MILAILTAISLLASILALGLVVRAKVQQREQVREEYAFKCLSAITSLVVLAVASISSKESLVDQIFSLFARVIGHPVPEAPPVPFSEKALIGLIIAIAIYAIIVSHGKWRGELSADEVDRERMKRSNSLILQALDEGRRLAKRQPRRVVHKEQRRIDPVAIPDEPNRVWYDHARELFELWRHSSSLTGDGRPGWDPEAKCWVGDEQLGRGTIFLFCVTEKPNAEELSVFAEYARKRAGTKAAAIYCTYRNNNGRRASIPEMEVEKKITLISEEFLYRNIVDFSDYKTEIIRRVEKEHFAGSTVSISDIYTASAISADTEGRHTVSNNLGDFLNDWSQQPAGSHLALMGEYGQGKSTGALMYVYDSIRSGNWESGGRIPLLIELRGKSPANLSQTDLMAVWGQQYKFQASALMKLLIDGRLILIFEGFDEMANVADAESRVAHFRSLWRFAFPRSKIIFTGRRNLFFEDRELNVVFRTANEGNLTSFCRVLHLKPFDTAKIENSLRWVSSDMRKEIIDASLSGPKIFDVVSRPSLLYIVASLWSQLRSLLSQGSITSATVIDLFITHSYARQETKERDLNFMTLTTTERRYFHEGVAVYMASRGGTNQIANSDLRAIIVRLFNAYPQDVHISDEVIFETERPALKLRMADVDEAIEYIVTDVRTHGILVNDIGRRETFRFAHKSFYELLAAKVHAFELLDLDPVFYRSIRAAMDSDIGNADRTPEILRFFAEFLMSNVGKLSYSNSATSLSFDLLFGLSEWPSVMRSTVRNFFVLYIRITRDQRIQRVLSSIFYGNMLVQGLMVALISSDIMVSHSPTLKRLKHFFDSSNSLSSWNTVMGAVLVIMFVYAKFRSERLNRKAILWSAVLLASDHSSRSNSGGKAIVEVFGPNAARNLIEQVSSRYDIQPYTSG
jgi:hypothetical protein